MSEVKRYTFQDQRSGQIYPVPMTQYVLASDYAALEAQVAELTQKFETITVGLNKIELAGPLAAHLVGRISSGKLIELIRQRVTSGTLSSFSEAQPEDLDIFEMTTRAESAERELAEEKESHEQTRLAWQSGLDREKKHLIDKFNAIEQEKTVERDLAAAKKELADAEERHNELTALAAKLVSGVRTAENGWWLLGDDDLIEEFDAVARALARKEE